MEEITEKIELINRMQMVIETDKHYAILEKQKEKLVKELQNLIEKTYNE